MTIFLKLLSFLQLYTTLAVNSMFILIYCIKHLSVV